MFKEYASYGELIEVSANQLGTNLNLKSIKLKYNMKNSNTPMKVHNDMCARIYVQLKKESHDFSMYPLYVNAFDKVIKNIVIDEIAVDTDDTLAMVIVDFGESFIVDKSLIIANPNQREIMVDQVYRDKATIQSCDVTICNCPKASILNKEVQC
ncbi:hypothetical protein HAX54_040199 [Datura stramonium]|uniref:Uncharacterized protein n=1 Tax=Datura stramonium TaxID=4076 RepID=A0ABS8VR69_DATST|nr:hypothetical protein [Datura stramonium]